MIFVSFPLTCVPEESDVDIVAKRYEPHRIAKEAGQKGRVVDEYCQPWIDKQK